MSAGGQPRKSILRWSTDLDSVHSAFTYISYQQKKVESEKDENVYPVEEESATATSGRGNPSVKSYTTIALARLLGKHFHPPKVTTTRNA